MAHFTPILSTVGGALIGLSAGLMLLLKGRVAGISGITGGLLGSQSNDVPRRTAFLIGLITAGGFCAWDAPQAFGVTPASSDLAVIFAGLCVGYGTRLGNGCTSGHGVCGISRWSMRSLAATGTFMATAGITVYLVRHCAGGG